MTKIGFVGLGIMGRPMSKNLLKAGYALTVFDLNKEAVADVVAAGAGSAGNCRELAAKCRVIITMLPNSPQVKEVICGAGGLLETAAPGTVFVDMSSINPIAAQEIGAEVARHGGVLLDSPVSGGEPKAIDGSLSIMCGGDNAVFEQVLPILQAMGKSVTYCGALGAGNTTKLANQIVVAVNIAAVGEALMLGKRAGVEPETIFQAIRGGLAGSTVMEAKVPMMLAGNFKPGFKIALHIKDLDNVVAAGHAVGTPLPLTTVVMEMMQWLRSAGRDSLDHSALVQYYEYLTGDSVKKEEL